MDPGDVEFSASINPFGKGYGGQRREAFGEERIYGSDCRSVRIRIPPLTAEGERKNHDLAGGGNCAAVPAEEEVFTGGMPAGTNNAYREISSSGRCRKPIHHRSGKNR